MNRLISAPTAIRAAQVACAVALAVLFWALLTASRIDVAEARAASPATAVPRDTASTVVSDAEFAHAVATDLFADDRDEGRDVCRAGCRSATASAFRYRHRGRRPEFRDVSARRRTGQNRVCGRANRNVHASQRLTGECSIHGRIRQARRTARAERRVKWTDR
jgi:hypothetical protein